MPVKYITPSVLYEGATLKKLVSYLTPGRFKLTFSSIGTLSPDGIEVFLDAACTKRVPTASNFISDGISSSFPVGTKPMAVYLNGVRTYDWVYIKGSVTLAGAPAKGTVVCILPKFSISVIGTRTIYLTGKNMASLLFCTNGVKIFDSDSALFTSFPAQADLSSDTFTLAELVVMPVPVGLGLSLDAGNLAITAEWPQDATNRGYEIYAE